MRTRVYRNFTFKAYVEENGGFITRSDNFFTVESCITTMLKDSIADGIPNNHVYVVVQESKDGKWSRVIERIYLRENDDAIYIDMVE